MQQRADLECFSTSINRFDISCLFQSSFPPFLSRIADTAQETPAELASQASSDAGSPGSSAGVSASSGKSSSFLPKLVLVQMLDTHEYELWHTNPQEPARAASIIM